MQAIDIALPNQELIGASLWLSERPQGVVLLHPATAVKQTFYRDFASWLHGEGFHVLTYDYRGTGASLRGPLRECTVSMSDWMEHDVAAVTHWALERFAELPVVAVGHSVGGHAIVLGAGATELCGAVLIASHAGVTRTIRGALERLRVALVMRVLAPLLCRLSGYMPGSRLGLGEDLPRNVMMQWSRWTRLPRYFYDDPAMRAAQRAGTVALPLLVLGFSDDPWANRHAMDLLLQPLTNADIERHEIAPQEAQARAIGHMGFFRRRQGAALWPQVRDWLGAHCAAHQELL